MGYIGLCRIRGEFEVAYKDRSALGDLCKPHKTRSFASRLWQTGGTVSHSGQAESRFKSCSVHLRGQRVDLDLQHSLRQY
jgi:hypothetical protein